MSRVLRVATDDEAPDVHGQVALVLYRPDLVVVGTRSDGRDRDGAVTDDPGPARPDRRLDAPLARILTRPRLRPLVGGLSPQPLSCLCPEAADCPVVVGTGTAQSQL